MPLEELCTWLQALEGRLQNSDQQIAQLVIPDLIARVQRLVAVGVGYLTMERATPSLSTGESQRLRLASLLGSGLTGILYILDEPTTRPAPERYQTFDSNLTPTAGPGQHRVGYRT